MKLNWRDLGFKVLWTGVAAGLGVAATALADAPEGWAPIAIMVINAALAWTRQQLGTVPPPAPPAH